MSTLDFFDYFLYYGIKFSAVRVKIRRIKLNNSGNPIQIEWKGNGKNREITSVIIGSKTVEEKNIFGTISRDLASNFAELTAGENCLLIKGRGGPGYDFSFPVNTQDIQALRIFLKKPLTVKYSKDRLKISKVRLDNSSLFNLPRHYFPRLCLLGYLLSVASGLS